MAFWHEVCDDETIANNNKKIKELPAEIKKESEKYTKSWENPGYEKGEKSNRRTLETCLEELAKKWSTENGCLVVEEMNRLNEDINAVLKNMKSTLLSIAKVTVETSTTESDEVIDL